MNTKLAALVLAAGGALASCASNETTAVAPAPPAVAAPIAAAPMPALAGMNIGAPLSRFGGIFKVNRITCGQLLAPGRDRDAATIFVYGYLVARSGNRDIDTGKVDIDLHQVIDRCTQSPDITVTDAFRRTSSTPARWIWQTP